jgi:hypothetical protein
MRKTLLNRVMPYENVSFSRKRAPYFACGQAKIEILFPGGKPKAKSLT